MKGHFREGSALRRGLALLPLPSRLLFYILGGFVLMSPLPDELGVILLGISHMDAWKFAALSFAFKYMGVLAIAGISLMFLFPPA